MMRKTLLGLAALLFVLPAQADIFDINAGEKSFRASLYGALPELLSVPTGQYDIGGVLRPEKQEDLLQLYVGALLTGEYGWSDDFRFATGLGVRALYVGKDHDSGGAAALGGMFEMRFPNAPELGFSGYFYGAPEALSFGEVREYIEYAPSIDYKFTPDAALYVGYRYIRYDIGAQDDVIADDSAHVGLRLRF